MLTSRRRKIRTCPTCGAKTCTSCGGCMNPDCDKYATCDQEQPLPGITFTGGKL